MKYEKFKFGKWGNRYGVDIINGKSFAIFDDLFDWLTGCTRGVLRLKFWSNYWLKENINKIHDSNK